MTAVVYPDRLSDGDALYWHVERDPVLRSTVTLVWLAEAAPDRERFDNAMRGAVHKVPRLHQKIVHDPAGGPPRWIDDHLFDPAFHVRWVGTPGQGTLRDVLDYAAPVAMQAFDKDRPLWEMHMLGGLADGRFAAVMKIHHAIGDGAGMIELTGSMVERGPDVQRRHYEPWRPDGAAMSPLDLARSGVRERVGEVQRSTARAAMAATRLAGTLVRDPLGAVRAGLGIGASAGRLLEPTTTPMSPLMVGRSASCRFDAISVPLADLKTAGQRLGGTVNDVFLAALAGAVRRYHDDGAEACPPAIRVNMAINVRDEATRDAPGNHLSAGRLVLPLEVDDAGERVRGIHVLVEAARGEAALPYLMGVMGGIGRISSAGSARLLGAMQKGTDVVASNLPGSPVPIWFSGARIDRLIPFGPRVGAAVNVTMMSYAGTCDIALNTDPVAVSRPAELAEHLRLELKALTA